MTVPIKSRNALSVAHTKDSTFSTERLLAAYPNVAAIGG